LVRTDGVVGAVEEVDLDRQRVAVVDPTAVHMLILQGAEVPLDHPVGLQ
jgi:hypothetical protein